jgi:predicted DNA-binding transcriptional regulator AlpA
MDFNNKHARKHLKSNCPVHYCVDFADTFALIAACHVLARNKAMEPVFTIDEFCQAYKLTPDNYYAMQRNGTGPEVIRIGYRTVRLSLSAIMAWEKARTGLDRQGIGPRPAP